MTTPQTSTQPGGVAASFTRPRRVREVITPQMVIEGAGVLLRRSFGPTRANPYDPFLLFDHFAFNDPKEGPILGFPTHPHRGIETVTYMLEGNVRHRDSLGNMGVIGPGDVQWMTSGRGILHEEMPHRSPEGKVNGFQLWVNLPARQKMSAPRYQGVDAADMPAARAAGRTVRVVAGSFDGVLGPVTAITAGPLYVDVSMEPRSELTVPVAPGETLLAYIFEGAGTFGLSDGEQGTRVDTVHMVVFQDGDHLQVRADDTSPVRFMLIAGAPFGESIVPYGPFVMNTEEEIRQALADLRNGTFVTP
jgi:redox-sensitive bicupin YhaK (pirin superfamily)